MLKNIFIATLILAVNIFSQTKGIIISHVDDENYPQYGMKFEKALQNKLEKAEFLTPVPLKQRDLFYEVHHLNPELDNKYFWTRIKTNLNTEFAIKVRFMQHTTETSRFLYFPFVGEYKIKNLAQMVIINVEKQEEIFNFDFHSEIETTTGYCGIFVCKPRYPNSSEQVRLNLELINELTERIFSKLELLVNKPE